MEYITIIIIAILAVLSIFGGFYFGYKLGKNQDVVELAAKKLIKPKKILNSVVDNNDEVMAEYEVAQEQLEEEKAIKTKYGLQA